MFFKIIKHPKEITNLNTAIFCLTLIAIIIALIDPAFAAGDGVFGKANEKFGEAKAGVKNIIENVSILAIFGGALYQLITVKINMRINAAIVFALFMYFLADGLAAFFQA